ncbi:hypothetical protein BEL04_18780 [Mucilaginibacter sp. PPCGB 2223]|uniref:hypothetical protein n=1 Tax=Mucilaginibacter sp. PPCGB 2223 TaxID=1886027 RepID=UPI000825E78A|nr:hypothetical protein [Mucilaginibacter sp. PPCGB 2223]OCX50780.1 hypothetical protein BEL04_18780 [Mucilaginibacter sp. PPCGB 2223]
MKPLYFSVDNNKPLMVVPETKVELDGHPVISVNYHIYKKHQYDYDAEPVKKDNPDYMGYITFEIPDKVFSYTADGYQELSSDEVREAIEKITYYRENPELWNL